MTISGHPNCLVTVGSRSHTIAFGREDIAQDLPFRCTVIDYQDQKGFEHRIDEVDDPLQVEGFVHHRKRPFVQGIFHQVLHRKTRHHHHQGIGSDFFDLTESLYAVDARHFDIHED